MILRARGLIVERGGKRIVSNADFQASKGELIGILGPSGSGKTTLLLALAGFRPAKPGTVIFDGRNLYEDFDAVKHRIGYVPQDDIVPTALSVERVLQYAAELRIPQETADLKRSRVEGIMQRLGLAASRKNRVSNLSGGQRKRVSVAVELISRPEVLFADEPTSGLDPALERQLTEMFKNLTEAGNTVIVTTHILTSLDLYDRLVVINRGQVVYDGTADKMKEHFGVDDFIQVYGALEAQTRKSGALGR